MLRQTSNSILQNIPIWFSQTRRTEALILKGFEQYVNRTSCIYNVIQETTKFCAEDLKPQTYINSTEMVTDLDSLFPSLMQTKVN